MASTRAITVGELTVLLRLDTTRINTELKTFEDRLRALKMPQLNILGEQTSAGLVSELQNITQILQNLRTTIEPTNRTFTELRNSLSQISGTLRSASGNATQLVNQLRRLENVSAIYVGTLYQLSGADLQYATSLTQRNNALAETLRLLRETATAQRAVTAATTAAANTANQAQNAAQNNANAQNNAGNAANNNANAQRNAANANNQAALTAQQLANQISNAAIQQARHARATANNVNEQQVLTQALQQVQNALQNANISQAARNRLEVEQRRIQRQLADAVQVTSRAQANQTGILFTGTRATITLNRALNNQQSTLYASRSQIERTTRALNNLEQGGRRFALVLSVLRGALGGVFGGFTAISIVQNLTRYFTQFIRTSIEASNQYQQFAYSTRIVARDTATMIKLTQVAEYNQRLFGGTLAENIGELTGFTLVARAANVELDSLSSVAQRLALFDPVQGVSGASTALREFLSGNIRSLRERFELPANILRDINRPELTAQQRLDRLSAFLDAQGLSAENVAGRLDLVAQAYADIGIAAEKATLAIGNILSATFVEGVRRTTIAIKALVGDGPTIYKLLMGIPDDAELNATESQIANLYGGMIDVVLFSLLIKFKAFRAAYTKTIIDVLANPLDFVNIIQNFSNLGNDLSEAVENSIRPIRGQMLYLTSIQPELQNQFRQFMTEFYASDMGADAVERLRQNVQQVYLEVVRLPVITAELNSILDQAKNSNNAWSAALLKNSLRIQLIADSGYKGTAAVSKLIAMYKEGRLTTEEFELNLQSLADRLNVNTSAVNNMARGLYGITTASLVSRAESEGLSAAQEQVYKVLQLASSGTGNYARMVQWLSTVLKLNKDEVEEVIKAHRDFTNVAIYGAEAMTRVAEIDADVAELQLQLNRIRKLGNDQAIRDIEQQIAALGVLRQRILAEGKRITAELNAIGSGGGSAGSSAVQSLENAVNKMRSIINDYYKSILAEETKFQRQLLDIQKKYADMQLQQQRENEVNKRRSRFEFYSFLVDLQLDQNVANRFGKMYEDIFAKAMDLARSGQQRLSAEFLSMSSRHLQDQIQHYNRIQGMLLNIANLQKSIRDANREAEQKLANARKKYDEDEAKRQQELNRAWIERDGSAILRLQDQEKTIKERYEEEVRNINDTRKERVDSAREEIKQLERFIKALEALIPLADDYRAEELKQLMETGDTIVSGYRDEINQAYDTYIDAIEAIKVATAEKTRALIESEGGILEAAAKTNKEIAEQLALFKELGAFSARPLIIDGTIKPIGDAFEDLNTAVANFYEDIEFKISQIPDQLREIASNAGSAVGGGFSGGLQEASEEINNAITELYESAENSITNQTPQIEGAVRESLQSVSEGYSDFREDIGNTSENIGEYMVRRLREAIEVRLPEIQRFINIIDLLSPAVPIYAGVKLGFSVGTAVVSSIEDGIKEGEITIPSVIDSTLGIMFGANKPWVKASFDLGVMLADNIIEGIKKDPEGAKNVIESVINNFISQFPILNIGVRLSSIGSTLLKDFITGFRSLDESQLNTLSTVVNNIIQAVPVLSLAKQLNGLGTNLTRNIINGFKSLSEKDKETLSNVIENTIQKIPSASFGLNMYNLGRSLIQGFINGSNSLANAAKGAISKIVNDTIAAGKKSAESRSPSRKTQNEIGIPLGQGIVVGLNQTARALDATMSSLVQNSIASAADFSSIGAGTNAQNNPSYTINIDLSGSTLTKQQVESILDTRLETIVRASRAATRS